MNDLTKVVLSNIKQLAQNVWKVTAAGNHYAVKLEKKTFLRMAHDPNNQQGWEMRWTDLKWATDLFMEICKNDRVHPWSRPLASNELAFVWSLLPGNKVPQKEQTLTLATVTDFIDNQVDFNGCKNGNPHLSLKALLEGKGDPPSLRALGRGLAVDLFLGNNDRYAQDDQMEGGLFVNLDNFFLHCNPSGPNSIFYMDFWDPNSTYNSKNKFPTTLEPVYLGPLLANDKGRTLVATAMAKRLSSKLNIQNVNIKAIADGLKSGAADLGKFLNKDKKNVHIARRLAACGIK